MNFSENSCSPTNKQTNKQKSLKNVEEEFGALPEARGNAWIEKGFSGISTITSLPSSFKVLRYGSKG
jgi:hypothetical protein